MVYLLIYLVVSTQLNNISQNWNLPQIGMKKKYFKPLCLTLSGPQHASGTIFETTTLLIPLIRPAISCGGLALRYPDPVNKSCHAKLWFADPSSCLAEATSAGHEKTEGC